MKCRCRHCGKIYEHYKARGNYRGYCTIGCEHKKAKELGYTKKNSLSEYQILNNRKALGDLPIALEEITELFGVEPKKSIKAWWWRIGLITLAKHEKALAKMEGVEVEWMRKVNGKWEQTNMRKYAEGAIVRIKFF